jgi:hypothetical protein
MPSSNSSSAWLHIGRVYYWLYDEAHLIQFLLNLALSLQAPPAHWAFLVSTKMKSRQTFWIQWNNWRNHHLAPEQGNLQENRCAS